MAIENNLITSEHLTGHGKIIRPRGLVIIHGAAGSGKGTAAAVVAEQMTARGLHTVHFASGDALREKYDANSNDPKERRIAEIADCAQEYMRRGDLVPVGPMTELIKLRLQQINENEQADEIILDGFPRSREQDLALRRLLGADYIRRDVLIDAILPTAKARAEKRGRKDDTKDAIERRMNLFYFDESDKGGILQMVYQTVMDIRDGKLNSRFHRIDAAQTPETVQAELFDFAMRTSPIYGMNIRPQRHRVHGQYVDSGTGLS